jgi:hypothetical protein
VRHTTSFLSGLKFEINMNDKNFSQTSNWATDTSKPSSSSSDIWTTDFIASDVRVDSFTRGGTCYDVRVTHMPSGVCVEEKGAASSFSPHKTNRRALLKLRTLVRFWSTDGQKQRAGMER